MTSEYNMSRFDLFPKKIHAGQLLFSPVTLMVLLALLFTFFMTASKGKLYLNDNADEREIIKTEMPVEKSKKGAALQYERIMTGAAPMPSILQ